jgi:hypothetical protein
MEGKRKPASRFRLQAKGWFLTYPKCTMSKEDALASLKAKKTYDQIVVSRELHLDGTPHLHVYIKYATKFDLTNERFFDLGSFHPNIQVAKSLKAVLEYIKKDGDYIEEGIDFALAVEAMESHKAYLGKRFLDGEDPTVIVAQNPLLFFTLDKIERCLDIWKKWQTPQLPRCTGFIPNSFGHILTVSASKDRHYWFWSSSPNKGKTTFLRSIQSQYPSLWYNKAEKYQSPSLFAQFVLLDEYSIGHLTVTQLNEMCDGTYQYPVKGSSPFALPTSIVLVCGNRSPMDIYEHKHHDLIKARFNIICLE